MGTMNFGLFPMLGALQGASSTIGSAPISKARATASSRTPSPISRRSSPPAPITARASRCECYDIGHLYTLAHFVDRGLVKPPFFVQSVFGILGGIGAHPEDVAAYEAHRRPPVRQGLPLVGAGRGTQPDADRRDVGRDGRQCARRPRGFALARTGQARRVRTPRKCAMCARSSRASAFRSRPADEAREMLALKGGDRVAF